MGRLYLRSDNACWVDVLGNADSSWVAVVLGWRSLTLARSMTGMITIRLQIPAQRLRRVLARHHWHDLERHQIGPGAYPALQQRDVICFHQLETPAEVGRHPAAYELQSIRHHASLFAQAAINRLGLSIAESFDDHEHHRVVPQTRGRHTTTPNRSCFRITAKSPGQCPLWVISGHLGRQTRKFASEFQKSSQV